MLSSASRTQVGNAGYLRGLTVSGAVVVLLALGGVVRADELYVPGDYGTIQAAIDAAGDGDEVVIADDTYTGDGNRDLDFSGKAITVRSASGDPALCVIDCGGTVEEPHRGFYFHSGEEAESVVDGLTIINGYAPLESVGDGSYSVGGAICCVNASSPTVRRCVLRSNYAFGDDPATAGGFGGGAICCWASDPTIEYCWISDNETGDDGAGVFCYSSSATLLACVIAGNDAGDSGGGVYCRYGGAPQLRSCLVHGNRADHGGDKRGGGVFCRDGASVLLENCTLCRNAAQIGGGLRAYNATATVYNCILWYNTASESGPQIAISGVSGNALVTYSNVEGCGWTGVGNICGDPLFADPDGADDNASTWEDNDYRMTYSSDCVDAGDPEFVAEAGELDLDGNLRLWDGGLDGVAVVDMGAFEFGATIYGDTNCDGYVTFDDITPFVTAIVGQAEYEAQYPGCNWLTADCDFNGAVNFDDIDAFVGLIVGGG